MTIRRMVFSRNRYFYGRLLTVSDFQAEQQYLRDKQQFRNLHTHGVGIVSGLSVKTQDVDRSLHISSGYAIDRFGRDVCVPSTVECTLPVGHQRLLVWVGYAETEAEPTPALGRAPMTTGSPVEHARTEEGFEVTLTPIPPGIRLGLQRIQPSQDDPSGRLLLAMLQRKGARWVVAPIPRRTRGPSAKANLKKDKRKRT
jgi:hypothetical protein